MIVTQPKPDVAGIAVPIRIRGYHLDVYGHVNNSRYLEFFEEARWAYLEGVIDLLEWKAKGIAFAVVNININYRRAAYLHDDLWITAQLTRVGEKSAVIHQTILNEQGDVIADADVTFVLVDEKTGRAMPIGGEVAKKLASLRGAPAFHA